MQGDPVEVVHFPTTTEQVATAVRSALEAGHRVAVSGARTGITGGAVPRDSQEIISLERLRFRPVLHGHDDSWTVHVGTGTTIAELNTALETGELDLPDGNPESPLFYPVDPTELSAQLGGTIATNASGARTLYYGPTRDWVEALTVVTPDGRILKLRRGEVCARGGELRYSGTDGETRTIEIAHLPVPPTKHTAGYHLKPDMDAVDLFVGSEGTLGIITEAELRLARKPSERLFLTVFLESEETALSLVSSLRRLDGTSPLALEYFGPRAIELLRAQRSKIGAGGGLVKLPDYAKTALYAEFPFESEEQLDDLYAQLQDTLSPSEVDPQRTWAAFTEREMDRMKDLRHAVPEAVNTMIGQRQAQEPELHKVGTDMAVPLDSLGNIMGTYRHLLEREGLDYVIFGHIGNAHLHVNILPETAAEVQRAEALYLELAREVVALNGSVAAEHGIGRIKTMFMPVQYTSDQIESMRRVKDAIDPDGTLNPGVLLPAREKTR